MISHAFPESLLEENTFEQATGCPQRSVEEEATLGLSLAVRIQGEFDEVKGKHKLADVCKEGNGIGRKRRRR